MVAARKISVGKHFIVTVLLFFALIASCAAMQFSFDVGNRRATAFFGVSSAILCLASTLSLFAYVVHYVEIKKKRSSLPADPKPESCSSKIRLLLVLSVICSGCLVVLAYTHAEHILMKIVSPFIFIFCAVNTYRRVLAKV